jgi:beta-lactamase class A
VGLIRVLPGVFKIRGSLVPVTRVLILAVSLFSTMISLCPQDSRADEDLPARFSEDKKLSHSLRDIAVEFALDGEFPTEDGPERISLAVIDLTGKSPRFGGVYADNFIYPASVYKMYVAAEVLRQVSEGKSALDTARW